MCGSTAAENTAEETEAQLSKEMASNYNTVFGENQNIISSINEQLSPIISAGPSQQGMSPEQMAAERTEALDTTAEAGKQVSQSVNEALAGRGGGVGQVSPGALAQVEAQIGTQTAEQNASEQLGITNESYNEGRQNFFNATAQEAGTTEGLEGASTGSGGLADSAAGEALQGAQTIQQANDEWIAPVAGVAGAVAEGMVPHLPGMGGPNPTPGPNQG